MTGKKERQRKLAREHYQRQQARRAEQQARLRRISMVAGAVVAVGALVTGGFVLFSPSGKSASASAKPTSSSTPTPSATPTPTTSTVAEPAHHCTYFPGGSAARKVSLPPATPNWKASYTAAIKTNLGTIKVNLLNSKATCTVNSFVSLATQKYFNGTPCHRLTTAQSGIYVLQCGDPTGTGTGGPGYGFGNENLTGATYPAGTLAMAHSSQPNSNGSQFFIVYQNTSLPPQYTPFGTVVSGLGIVQNVAKAGSDNSNGQGDGHPKDKVDIESVTITKA